MSRKQSRTERGKQAILDMVNKVFPDVVNHEVILYDGTNRNALLNYALVIPMESNVEFIVEPPIFKKKCSEYFAPYYCSVTRRRSDPKLLSYVECKTCEIKVDIESVEHSYNLVADFEIKHYKDHVPYPDPESIGQMKVLLEVVQAMLAAAKKENIRLIKKNNGIITKSKKSIANMRRIITTLYESCPNKQSCPTCWEEITREKLFIPVCGHFICTDCKERLTAQNCPMCREPLSNI